MSYPNIIQNHNTDIYNLQSEKANKNELSKYLPLTGGTMLGSLRLNNSSCIWLDAEDYDYLCARWSENNDKSVVITSGGNSNTGGSIFLRGINHPTQGGRIILQSVSINGEKKYCTFSPNGELSIDGNLAMSMTEAVTVGEQWYWKFSNGMMFVGGTTTFGGVGTITFCQSFSYPPNHISVTARHSITSSAIVTSEVLTKTATYFQLSQRLGGVYQPSIDNGCRTEWLAIGWWK